jgi:hypothetical protein
MNTETFIRTVEAYCMTAAVIFIVFAGIRKEVLEVKHFLGRGTVKGKKVRVKTYTYTKK